MVAVRSRSTRFSVHHPPLAEANPQQVPVPAGDLLVGHTLSQPLYDLRGVLLLAGGSMITSRFKELIQKRGERSVTASVVDADEFAAAREAELGSGASLSPEASQLIGEWEEKVEQGEFGVANQGPPLTEQVQGARSKAYDPSFRLECRSEQRRGASTVHGLIGEVTSGAEVECHPLVTTAAESLALLLQDPDCAIAAVLNDLDGNSLSDHAIRTSILSMAVGIEMGYDEANVKLLGLCGLIHDWGMCRVRPELLESPHTLHPIDYLEIKKHPIWTLDLLQKISGLPTMAPLICYQVHERPDGQGYPRGRKTCQTHPFARVIQVVDTLSELISVRAYRRPLMPTAAIECLLTLAAENLRDADSVRHLLMVLSIFPPGSLLELSDGRLARSLRRNGEHYTAPLLEVLPRGASSDCHSSRCQVVDPLEAGIMINRALPRVERGEIELTASEVERLRR